MASATATGGPAAARKSFPTGGFTRDGLKTGAPQKPRPDRPETISTFSFRTAHLQAVAHHMDQRLDGQFDEQKRFADEVVAAGHGELVRLSKSLRLVTNTTGVFLCCGRGAAWRTVRNRSCRACQRPEKRGRIRFPSKVAGLLRVFDVDGLELGLFQRIDDGPAGNDLVIHHQNFRSGNVLLSGSVPFSNSKPRKSTAAAMVRMEEGLMFLGFS